MSREDRRRAQDMARRLQAAGVRVKETRSGYIAYPPDPTAKTVGWHRSPSDHRWFRNLTADLRRANIHPDDVTR